MLQPASSSCDRGQQLYNCMLRAAETFDGFANHVPREGVSSPPCMCNVVQQPRACLQGMYVFYLELVTDMLHLLVYVIFFIIVFTNYGLPLHLVRLFTHPADTSMSCISCQDARHNFDIDGKTDAVSPLMLVWTFSRCCVMRTSMSQSRATPP